MALREKVIVGHKPDWEASIRAQLGDTSDLAFGTPD